MTNKDPYDAAARQYAMSQVPAPQASAPKSEFDNWLNRVKSAYEFLVAARD
jgi:hypothetical protein